MSAWPVAALALSAARKPRGGLWRSAAASRSASGIVALRAATSARLVSRIRSRMSVMSDPAVQQRVRGTRIECFSGDGDTFGEFGCAGGDHQRGGGVEQDSVAIGAVLAGE